MSQPPLSPDKSRNFNSSMQKRGSSTQNPPSPPSTAGQKRLKANNVADSSSTQETHNYGRQIVDDDIENFAKEQQDREEKIKEKLANISAPPNLKPFVVPHIPPRNAFNPNSTPPRPSRPDTPTIPIPTTLYNPVTGKYTPFTSTANTPPKTTRPLPTKLTSPIVNPTLLPEDKKPYNKSSHTWKNKIEAEVWNDLVSKYGERDAQAIVEKLHAKYGRKLTAAETIHIFHNCNVNTSNAEKLQHEFRQHHIPSPFASKHKIEEERKKMHDDVEFETKNVEMKPDAKKPRKKVPVTSAKNVRNLIRKRMNNICRNKKYRKILFKGNEELWLAITCDKGKYSSKLGIQFGNTKKGINSPHNIMLIALYNGDDSQENLYAAFSEIVKQLREIKDINFTGEDGEEKTLPVRWFLVGDYKFLKAVAGLLSGNCKFPCVCCLSETKETYSSVDRSKSSTPRTQNIDSKNSQPLHPLFDFIPFSQYVPPSLHITLGPCADLFEELFERACILDAEDPTELIKFIKENPEYKKDVKEKCEDMDFLTNELSDANELQQLYNTLLNDIEENDNDLQCCSLDESCAVYLLQKNIPSNETTYCDKCLNFFHNCCSNSSSDCPICTNFHPSLDTATSKLHQEHQEILSYIEVIKNDMKQTKIELQKISQKFKPGKIREDLETLLEECGGSRQAFFQAYTGTHLLNMGKKIDKIIKHLPEAMKKDQKSLDICEGIRLFFKAKKTMSKNLDMSDTDIEDLEDNIQEFADFMKTKLGEMRPKQKGHLFLFHVVQFARLFKTSRFFTEQAIEHYHALFNKQDIRLKLRQATKKMELLMKWNVEYNYYYDNFDCDDFQSLF